VKPLKSARLVEENKMVVVVIMFMLTTNAVGTMEAAIHQQFVGTRS
jgi:hypothetical protein